MKTIAWDEFSGVRLTGIGSLPHHNVDAALEFSFKLGIPFLPQIPIRNPWEYMIPQAVDGLPGVELEAEGLITLNSDIWESQSHILGQRLKTAFSKGSDDRNAFEAFEPTAPTSSCWQPFLWELQERKKKLAKVQIAGPMTTQWALKLKNGASIDRYPELSSQIFQLILARSLAMVNRMISSEIQPILYIDEPGLYALSKNQPKHLLCLQELKVLVQTLRKAGAIVGLHCCSNTDWEAVLELGIDLLSLDTALSLKSCLALKHRESLEDWLKRGGRFSFGIIPTTRSSALHSLKVQDLVHELTQQLNKAWPSEPNRVKAILKEALYTPACGLALQSTTEAELILEKLVQLHLKLHENH